MRMSIYYTQNIKSEHLFKGENNFTPLNYPPIYTFNSNVLKITLYTLKVSDIDT
jgi:hypothetical protein